MASAVAVKESTVAEIVVSPPLSAAAPIVTKTGVTAVGTNGQSRTLTKGATLDSGDTVRTDNGRAQLRFTDGAYVSLQPNTEFGIKEYKFEGKTDGTEKGFFSLVKGALRTVTGLVGRNTRGAYQIQTATATVGIRGTGGLIEVQPDGLIVAGGRGLLRITRLQPEGRSVMGVRDFLNSRRVTVGEAFTRLSAAP